MGSDSTDGAILIPPEQRPSVFALVIYIPGPLGKFLDELRLKLVPGCNPHAHVSLLPPRPLAVNWRAASEQLRATMESWAPFEIELTDIGIFPVTDVVYIEIGGGAAELRRMHVALNAGWLEFQDPFPYHPHITLAQALLPSALAETHRLAREAWRDYTGPRRFRAETAFFVQNSQDNCWIDLAEYALGGRLLKS